MMTSQSLPFELSSLSMRSAKFGQGTNSNFMLILVLAVKSLLSSTSALAGSQAAQHKVMVLSCARAAGLARLSAVAAARANTPGSIFEIDLMRLSPSGLRVQGHTPDDLQ